MPKLVCLAMLVATCPMIPLQAQTMVSPALSEESKPAKPSPQRTAMTVTLHAADEPDPPLRYRFWPAPEYRTNDSPAPFVSRAVLLAVQAQNTESARSDFAEKYSEWIEMPLEELPREEVRKFLARFGDNALRELARGENFMGLEYDLRLDLLSASELIQTVLPELQEMRQLARLLQLRIRLAVAQQRWQDAVDDLRLGFRLAEVAGHSTDFLIGRLVGFAISGIMMDATLEAIEQPGCPNLYWALASLPEHDLFDVRESIEFESVLISRIVSKAAMLPDFPIGAEAARTQIREMSAQASEALALGGSEGSDQIGVQLMTGLYVVATADESRELLASTTPWGQRAMELSASEAVLRASILRFVRFRDEWLKWSLLPEEVWLEYEAERTAAASGPLMRRNVIESMITMLTPAVDAASRAGGRTKQTRNLLITFEALRMHAAEHGELPVSLDSLRPVPCWDDSLARAPFGYARTSASTATLTRSERWPRDPETAFEIQLMKGHDE